MMKTLFGCLLVLSLLLPLAACSTRASSEQPEDVCGHIRDQDDKAECDRRAGQRFSRADQGSLWDAVWSSGFSGISTMWYLTYYLVGLVFSVFVYRDAKQREWRTFRIPALWWGAACLFQPAMGAIAYWVMHYSRLSRHSK
jgi:hypothetical protein